MIASEAIHELVRWVVHPVTATERIRRIGERGHRQPTGWSLMESSKPVVFGDSLRGPDNLGRKIIPDEA